MNHIDRLFAILVILQSKSPVRAQDLAERFEVSERNIYRDIASLYESGVPVVSLPAKGYALMPGYYLPPLVFTADVSACRPGLLSWNSYLSSKIASSISSPRALENPLP